MRRTYLTGLASDLITRAGHPGITGVKPWHGPSGDPWVTGLWIDLTGGAGLGVQVVASSPPTGGHSAGPEQYDPATGPTGSLPAVPTPPPTGARAVADWLAEMLGACGHEEIASVTRRDISGRSYVSIGLTDQSSISCQFASATGPGGRRLTDYEPAQWGQLA